MIRLIRRTPVAGAAQQNAEPVCLWARTQKAREHESAERAVPPGPLERSHEVRPLRRSEERRGGREVRDGEGGISGRARH